ncbi:MAG: alpha-galactosidase [Lentisphaeria bacterium]|nr:alpha-galactosidase [Lentisphaeria bacterium]
MEQIFKFPFGTQFVYDTESKLLTLTSLCGMICAHNGKEDDYACSGLAILGIDQQRLEGRKLQYDLPTIQDHCFTFTASDSAKTVQWKSVWTFEEEYGIISCEHSLKNCSEKTVVVRRALPRWVFTPGDYEVFWQMSRWGAENQLQHQKLRGNDLLLHGRAARSTIGSTPFSILKDCENNTAVAFHVLPLGNWTIQIHSNILSNEYPSPTVEAGLADTDLFMTLQPGETVELPEILIQNVPCGDFLQSSAPLHKYMIRKRIPANFHIPPVVYNSWLYRFSDFTKEQLLQQLQAAKEVGCEVFVVDAGWYGDGDSCGQAGDWREKQGEPFYGNMKAFADDVRAAGLKFGFWMEPERWAANIPIRSEHPEWFPEHTSRIDLTQPAAAEYFYNVIAENVKKFGAEYIKIDFNAAMGYDESGTELHNYCSVLKTIFRRLRNEFPNLHIENCGSGSLRNDLNTACLYDHAFISDNANPYETLRIRQGTIMRSVPGRILNWLVMYPAPERRTPVSNYDLVLADAAGTWDEAALFNLDYVMISGLLGIPGFSGDLAEFDAGMKKKMAVYIQYYKDNRKFFTDSHVYLLTAPDSSVTDYEKYMVFQMQSDVCDDSLLFVFTNGYSRRAMRNFRLLGLDPAADYRIETLFSDGEEELVQSGADLMSYGLKTQFPEYMHVRHQAKLYRITRL